MTYMACGAGVEAQHMSFCVLALEEGAAEPGPPSFRIPGLHKEYRFDAFLHWVFSK
jgi:hypothetical protein